MLQWLDHIWNDRPWYGKALFALLALALPTLGATIMLVTWQTSYLAGTSTNLFLECFGGLFVLGGGWCLIQLATHFSGKTTTTHGSARFASMKDVQSMAGTRANARAKSKASKAVATIGGNLELGTYRRRSIELTHKQQESHVLLLAPTGQGKTSGVIIPALLNENGERSMLVNDVKGELIGKTAGAIQRHSEVKIFAPTKPSISSSYNPLAHIRSVEDAEDVADAWITNTGTSEKEPFWDRAASVLITAVILHLTQGARRLEPFSSIADILTGMTLDQIKQVLENSPSPHARRSMVAFMNSISNNPKLGGSILLEVSSRFRLLNNPSVRTATGENEFDFDAFIEDPSCWFISIPASEAKRIKPLSACFLMQLMKRLTSTAEESADGRLPRNVVFYLDEFINAGRIVHFEEHISLVRSAGIAFILAVQDFGQLRREYGDDIADTILANTTTHVVFPSIGQKEAQYYSDRMGDSTVTSRSMGQSFDLDGNFTFSYTDSESQRRLMNPDEIRTMAMGNLLVLHGNYPPLIVRNTPYYQREDLMAKIGLQFRYPTRVYYTPPVPPRSLPPAQNYQQPTPPGPGQNYQQPAPPSNYQQAPPPSQRYQQPAPPPPPSQNQQNTTTSWTTTAETDIFDDPFSLP